MNHIHFNRPSQFSSIPSFSHVWFFVTPWTAAHQAFLSITNSWRSVKLMSIEWWCHPTMPSSVVPFSSHFQSLPASGSFQMSQLFASGGQNIVLELQLQHQSFLPMNTQDWCPLQLPGLISVQSKGLSSLLQHHSSKALILWHSAFFIVQLSQLIKPITWTTALSNSMKLWAMPYRATQDGQWVMVESSDKTWSTKRGMANHFSILALRTP